jgi:exodeoxyribonuclease VII large subunit
MYDQLLQPPPVLQVSQLTDLIKDLLQEQFRYVVVEGELTNFRPASSGHWYFTLKDSEAMVQCVMFRSAASRIQLRPQDGDLLRINGSVSVYAARGAYQIIVQTMEHVGSGRILALLEDRKRRLASEGLFERQNEKFLRPLPLVPRSIAIVTSPTGAAIRDILQILKRRAPGLLVRILPVPVQGEAAGVQIAQMIEYAGRHRLGEVLIITRGGGSIEDLLPFSDEAVVRAIHRSPLHVISAVGHEIDWALSDYAADYRAPTPSAAAEIVCASREELTRRINGALQVITRTLQSELRTVRLRMETGSPTELLFRYRQFLQPKIQSVDDQVQVLVRQMWERIREIQRRLERATDRIVSADPVTPLRSGFALIRDPQTHAIFRRGTELSEAQAITIQFHDKTIAARTEVSTNGENNG